MRFVIVTGMSGAGKSTAMKQMEDMGYHCIDNLPIPMLENLVDYSLCDHVGISNLAVGIDIRNWKDIASIPEMLEMMRKRDFPYEILFMDADDNTLVKRYKETRRSHPLAMNERVDQGIGLEREKLKYLKQHANYIIDTSRLLTRELRSTIEKIFVKNQSFKSLYVTVLSFGFKYGIPADADLVMDVRFLPNPYYDLELRPKTGMDREIQDFVMKHKESQEFLERYTDLIRFLIPHYISEGKTQLVIAIGCTGGKHRSVTIANELYHKLEESGDYGLKIEHRDILRY